ncbi:MAG: hypothetical protein KAJ69_04365 [Thermoplasmatales archaeon]|nr:hypothetical protein [Thermoplasmatales archaeon]
MTKDEEIIIRVEKEKMKKLKELGISAQDVFSKGLYELLREKYGGYLTSDDDFDEFIEDDDFTDFMGPKNKFEEIIVSDSDIDNN